LHFCGRNISVAASKPLGNWKVGKQTNFQPGIDSRVGTNSVVLSFSSRFLLETLNGGPLRDLRTIPPVTSIDLPRTEIKSIEVLSLNS
jgi:hypothetical protein